MFEAFAEYNEMRKRIYSTSVGEAIFITSKGFMGLAPLNDDDNLIVFPPKADDNSNIFIYSIHVQWKIRPECGTSFTMTPAHCYIHLPMR